MEHGDFSFKSRSGKEKTLFSGKCNACASAQRQLRIFIKLFAWKVEEVIWSTYRGLYGAFPHFFFGQP